MIGLDTNVLLRVVLHDDPIQLGMAHDLLTSEVPGGFRLANIVLCELVWSLQQKRKWPPPRIVAAIRHFLAQEAFVIENRAAVMDALRNFEVGPADFADYLIGALNAEAGATSTFTFDQDAARHGHFTLVGSASPDAEGSRR